MPKSSRSWPACHGGARLGQADVDQLQAVEHNQRETDQVLTSRREGVPMHVVALLADLENNRFPSDDVLRRDGGPVGGDRPPQPRAFAGDRPRVDRGRKTGQVELEGKESVHAVCQPRRSRHRWPPPENIKTPCSPRRSNGFAGPTGPVGQLSPLPPGDRPIAARTGRRRPAYVGSGPPHRGRGIA